ncbi:MAG: hypothetical protein FWB85_06255 [Chitinispirillia bacterium]|nr:hypothetical protein [Chitinispirillia bacterium]MCL2241810.1 hypothetical protein [Chitinispirillia bacterium]
MSRMMRMAGIRQCVNARRYEFFSGLLMAMSGIGALVIGGFYLMHSVVGK